MAAKPRKKRRKPEPHRTYVIVPKSQMRAKTPSMLVHPTKIEAVQLTTNPAHATRFTTRGGAFKHIEAHKHLQKRFWYRRVA